MTGRTRRWPSSRSLSGVTSTATAPPGRLRASGGLGGARSPPCKESAMIDSAFMLEKKIALVVGAANGIGRATALAFAASGAAVACADVEDAKATAAEIE